MTKFICLNDNRQSIIDLSKVVSICKGNPGRPFENDVKISLVIYFTGFNSENGRLIYYYNNYDDFNTAMKNIITKMEAC